MGNQCLAENKHRNTLNMPPLPGRNDMSTKGCLCVVLLVEESDVLLAK
jgi:hypothetical protein